MGIFSKALKVVSSPLAVAANPAIGLPAMLGKKAAGALGLKLDGEEGAYHSPEEVQSGLYRAFANDYDNQMKLADKGVQESALTRDLFGEGGLQSQLANENRQLSSRGFQLTPEDREAYGQVSGDISRLFGQQEQDVSKSLARRGLGGASSGAAGAMYSGLAGNKNEMLANAQTEIASRRMADTRARVNDTRSLMASLGIQGSGLARERYQDKGTSLLQSVKNEAVGNDQRMAARSEQAENYTPGLGDAFKAGLMSSASSIGAAPGNFASSLAGGGGQAAGSSLFGSKRPKAVA